MRNRNFGLSRRPTFGYLDPLGHGTMVQGPTARRGKVFGPKASILVVL